ncbi:MAG: PLP-dependent aspartate aminotransferase family protein [bacterium]|nr:PLP-dependent aspartate aminotransferase family protein [bacterium]
MATRETRKNLHPTTAAFHAGYDPLLSEQSVKVPVFRTSTHGFTHARDGEKSFQRAYHLPGDDGRAPGLIYARVNNPSIEIFEDKITAMERSAMSAMLFPSGMSAISTTILALVPHGGRILYCDPVYGGSYFFLKTFCPARFGTQTMCVNTCDLTAVETALREHGPFDMVYLETPANPTLSLTDIGAVVALTRKYGKPDTIVAVDNTFLGPVFQHPFELGADIVLYSATKFIGGHSDLMAGVTLLPSDRHRQALEDYRTILGDTPAPDTAWMLTRSLETLWIRMEAQAKHAMAVAHAIAEHPKVERVLFPGLLTPTNGVPYEVYKRQCSGPGSVMSFVLKDATRDGAFRVLDAMQIARLAVSLGGTQTLISHPRSMTHSDMTIEDLDRCGITEGMIRLSVGLEYPDDLIEDLLWSIDQA